MELFIIWLRLKHDYGLHSLIPKSFVYMAFPNTCRSYCKKCPKSNFLIKQEWLKSITSSEYSWSWAIWCHVPMFQKFVNIFQEPTDRQTDMTTSRSSSSELKKISAHIPTDRVTDRQRDKLTYRSSSSELNKTNSTQLRLHLGLSLAIND